MEYLQLGTSDLRVSPICVGTWQFNNGQTSADKTWPAQDEQVSRAIVDKAIELGVNFFDTAEGYLNSEVTLGKILEGRRKNVIVATKVGVRCQDYSPTDIEQSLANSLQRLQTDYIDLYQVHYAPYLEKNLEANVAELNRQKAKGTIREWAVCNYGPQNLEDIIKAGGRPLTNQLSYNLLWRAIEFDILPACQKHNINVLPYSPLQQGLLTGKFLKPDDVPVGRRRTKLFSAASNELAKHGGDGHEKQLFDTIGRLAGICESVGVSMSQAAIGWLLQQHLVSSVIVGGSSAEQIQKNCNIVQLQQEALKKLTEATEDLKFTVGNNPDPWAAVSRIK